MYSINLPESCISIEKNAFYGCTNLQTIKGVGVEQIGYQAFYDCSSLFSVDMPNVKSIDKRSFASCLRLRDFCFKNLIEIPEKAFSGCSFTSVDFSKIEIIGPNAFEDNSKLFELKIKHPIKIGDKAFYNNISMENIYLESVVEEIGKYAFKNCLDLKSVNLPNYDGMIPLECFSGCRNLYDVNIPKATKVYGFAFYNCEQLKEIILNDVIDSGLNAFNGCNNLTKIQLDSAERIGDIPFSKTKVLNFPRCKYFGKAESDNLEYIYLPNCINVLYGFKAPNLKKVYLPRLESFGSDEDSILFNECYSLECFSLPNLVSVKGILYGSNEEGKYDHNQYSCKVMEYPKLCKIEEYYNKMFYNRCGNFCIINNLPDESSDEMLEVDFCSINPTFQWYYSKTGNEDSFEPIPNAISYSYKPNEDGYYYLTISCMRYGMTEDRRELEQKWGMLDLLKSNICHYTKKEKPVKTYNLLISSDEAFTVNIDNEIFSPTRKLTNYTFSQSVSEGSEVTVNYNDDNLEAWVNLNNRVVSKDNIFKFTMTSDINISAKAKRSLTVSSTVSFYNANGDFISSDKYSKYLKFKDNNYPANPTMYAHKFIGWNKSVSEINNELSAGRNVIVYAQFEKDTDYKSLYVIDGNVIYTDSDTENGSNYYKKFSQVTVNAKSIPGLNFWYWQDDNSGIASYDSTYSFYITCDTKLTAVYGFEKVTPVPVTRITNIDINDNKITFVAEHYVPSECEVLEHGIILTNDNTLDNESFIIGAENVIKGTSTQNTNCGTYTLTKKDVSFFYDWYARSYIIYKTKNNIITIYSEIKSN